MSVTDLVKVNLHDRRVVGRIDLRERFLDYLELAVLRHAKMRTTGASPNPDPGGWYSQVTATDGVGLHTLVFTGSDGGLYGTDGTGELLSVDDGDDRLDEIQFQDTGAVTYYMASKATSVPEGISLDVQTGVIYYDRYRSEMGLLAEPTVVVDNGDGTITLTLGNHKLAPADTFTGRSFVVYLKVPESGSESTAIETVVASGSTIVTVGDLGQTVISTTASDYEVVLIGPIISRQSTLVSDSGYAFIGTVVGGASPRTFDFDDQVELASLEQIARQGENLPKGWLSVPAATIGGGGANVSFGDAVAFADGRAYNVPAAGPIGSFPVSAEFWISYVISTGVYTVFTTWDTANAFGAIPVYWGRADGSSHVTTTTSRVIGVAIREFGQPLLITVSGDDSHRGAFNRLGNALAAAHSAQLGSTLTPPGIVIEIAGDVTVTAAITEQTLLGVKNVTFRGRGGGTGRSAVPGAGTSGARIIWNHDGPVFGMSSGAPVMAGWTFRDLTLRYTGTGTVDSTAFISSSTGTIQGLSFERCTLDGNTAMNFIDAGSGTGALPHLVFSNSGTVQRLSIDRCGIYCRDAAIYQADVAGGIVGLRVTESEFQNTSALIGTTAGIVQDDGTGSVSANWRIRDCQADAIRGTIISARRIDGMWIRGNAFQTFAVDKSVLDLGRNNASADIDSIFISENKILRTGISNPAEPLIKVRGEGAVRYFQFANDIEDADAVGASARAVSFAANTTPLSGPILFGNNIRTVENGIVCDGGDLASAIVFGNSVVATDTAYRADGGGEHLLFGNRLESTSGSTSALDVFGDHHVIFGNEIVMGSSGDSAVAFDAGCEGIAFVGNVIPLSSTPIAVDGDGHVIVGNVAPAGGSAVTVASGAQTNVIGANVLNGLTTSGAGTVVVGNYVAATIEYEAINTVMVGNRCDVIGSSANSGQTVIVGNRIDSGVEDSGDEMVLVGNHVGGATYAFAYTDSTIVGNVFPDASVFSLAGGSEDITLVGNYVLDGLITDAGTTNSVANNTAS